MENLLFFLLHSSGFYFSEIRLRTEHADQVTYRRCSLHGSQTANCPGSLQHTRCGFDGSYRWFFWEQRPVLLRFFRVITKSSFFSERLEERFCSRTTESVPANNWCLHFPSSYRHEQSKFFRFEKKIITVLHWLFFSLWIAGNKPKTHCAWPHRFAQE